MNKFFSVAAGRALLVLGALLATSVQAHSPRLACHADGEDVVCEGGFSDGSSAKGVEIKVMSYEDKVLWRGALDAESSVRFKRPKQDFYVRFEGGEGHSLEVDHGDIH